MFHLMRNCGFLVPLAMAWSLWAFVPSAAHADYVSQSVTLDQSNALKDGVAYGSVLIEAYDGVGAAGGGLKAGEVRLTYAANVVADYASLSKTFGIDHIGFNTDLAFSSGQISGPAGWKIGNKQTLSDFGKFTWAVDGNAKGGERLNPVTVLITGLGATATPAHFTIGSEGEGSVYFAMHVAGFTVLGSDIDGHFVGGSSTGPPPPGGEGDVQPTPEPATILLGGLGIGCLALTRLARRRKQV